MTLSDMKLPKFILSRIPPPFCAGAAFSKFHLFFHCIFQPLQEPDLFHTSFMFPDNRHCCFIWGNSGVNHFSIISTKNIFCNVLKLLHEIKHSSFNQLLNVFIFHVTNTYKRVGIFFVSQIHLINLTHLHLNYHTFMWAFNLFVGVQFNFRLTMLNGSMNFIIKSNHNPNSFKKIVHWVLNF